MNSRSEMKRLAVQNPDALIKEIESLREKLKTKDEVREILEDKNISLRAENEKLSEANKWLKGANDILIPENTRLREALESYMRIAPLTTPTVMGGTPDLFGPRVELGQCSDSWDAYEELVREAELKAREALEKK